MNPQLPPFTVLNGFGERATARRVLLSRSDRCCMCSTPTIRGEVVEYDGRRSEVGWCLPCWLRWARGTDTEPLRLLPGRAA